MSAMPINPAINEAVMKPMTAPGMLKPKITSAITRRVFMIDWQMSIMLFRCIFSVPVNAAVAALINPPVKMDKEAIWISGAIVGRLKTLVAKKPERAKEITDRTKPNAISKINPDTKMLLTSSALPSALYWAVNRIIAEFTPQSLKIMMRFGAVKTIAYKPYKSDPSNLAMKITPTEEMAVEITRPHRTLKPPLAETLAISPALLIHQFLS